MMSLRSYAIRPIVLAALLAALAALSAVAPAGGAWAQGVNTAPEFASSVLNRSVDENSAAGTDVGAPVTATDEGDTLT